MQVDRVIEQRISKILESHSSEFLSRESINELARQLVIDTWFCTEVKIEYDRLMREENKKLKLITEEPLSP